MTSFITNYDMHRFTTRSVVTEDVLAEHEDQETGFIEKWTVNFTLLFHPVFFWLLEGQPGCPGQRTSRESAH